jgi:hypothetical protein
VLFPAKLSTRSRAVERKATKRPSLEITGVSDWPSAIFFFASALTRAVLPLTRSRRNTSGLPLSSVIPAARLVALLVNAT